MVAYSFQQCFIDPIERGTKQQTIRPARRRRHARPGDALQLYTGMRTRACRLIGTATCINREPIAIDFRRREIEIGEPGLELRVHDIDTLNAFAVRDGFPGWLELVTFWRERHPLVFADPRQRFEGVRIMWRGFEGK